MNKIEHQWTNEIVCPWCGHKMSDSWDYNMDDGDTEIIECDCCGHKYEAVCCVTVEYCTKKTKN